MSTGRCSHHVRLLLLIGTASIAVTSCFLSKPSPVPHRRNFHHFKKSYTYQHVDSRWVSQPTTTHHQQLHNSIHLPLISANDSWGNLAVLTGAASLSQVLGKETSLGRLLGPPVTAMALMFGLASVGVVQSGGSPTAKLLQLVTLQLATPLVLLGADLRDCWERCGPLLLSFVAASSATLIACVVGWYLAKTPLQMALGASDSLKIAAALMAKNIGGGINYIAVCQSLNASSNAVAAGLCIDNIFALIYFPLTSALASGRPDVSSIINATSKSSDNTTQEHAGSVGSFTAPAENSISNVSLSLFLACALLWSGEQLGKICSVGALPCCTLLTVLFASWAPRRHMTALQTTANTLGTVCLYLFFATAGAPGLAVASSVKSAMLPLTLFLTSLYSIHGAILWAFYYVWGKRRQARNNGIMAGMATPQRLLVASSASIGGPATAVALAQANQWDALMVPALLVGNIGYAVATFLGLAFHSIVR